MVSNFEEDQEMFERRQRRGRLADDLIEDAIEDTDLEMESEDVDTVGGFVYHQLGRMPAPGDEVRADGLTMRVLTVAGRRVKKVRVTRQAREEEEERHE